MSGGQIGTVIGGAIGAYFGGAAGAQIGMAIGGLVGNAVDPQRINGPHIGDGQQQSATDGAAISWVQGSATVAGTIVQVGPRIEVKVQDSGGKGGGPIVSHYEAHQTFAILVCESSELRNSSIDKVVMVEQDGKIVYDVRPESQVLANSYEWANGVRFYYGAEDQLPDPILESITGIGNTPAYRGSCVVVFYNFNLTSAGDRIPSFRFTVSSQTVIDEEDHVLPTVEIHGDVEGAYPADDPNRQQILMGWMQDVPVDADLRRHFCISDIDVWAFQREWIVPLYADPINTDPVPIHEHEAQSLLKGYKQGIFDTGWTYSAGTVVPPAILDYFALNGLPLPTIEPLPTFPVPLDTDTPIRAYRVYNLGWFGPFDILPNTVTFKFSNDGGHDLTDIGRAYYRDVNDGKVWRSEWVVPYPLQIGDPTSLPLSLIVSRVAERGGLTGADVDASDLEGITVNGYPIARQATASDCLAPLLAAYFAYESEYDSQVHFHLYGENADLEINPLDLVESDVGSDGGSLVADLRNQATEFPKKMTSTYYDRAQNYNPVQVSFERSSSDVVAIGEQTFAIPVVMDADSAAQATQKAMKVAYARLEGTREYSLPLVGHDGQSYLGLTAGEPLLFGGKRWVLDEMTISHNMLHFKTTYNRQSAYTSNVQAIPGNPPLPPMVPDRSPTLLYAMNLPSLRPQDSYGIYVAVSGQTDRWPGCTIQVSYDKGMSWRNAADAGQASVMGQLTADLSVGSGSEPLSVNVVGDISSVDPSQIPAGANPAVILSDSDDVEIIQFETADELSEGNYDLYGLYRGRKDTVEGLHVLGDRFTMLDNVYFIPIDLQFGGELIYFRAVTFGTAAEDASVVQIIYSPDDEVILDGGGAPL